MSDSYTTYDTGKFFIILPSNNPELIKRFKKSYKIKKVKENFSYNSFANKKFLKIKEIRKLIIDNIDKSLSLTK